MRCMTSRSALFVVALTVAAQAMPALAQQGRDAAVSQRLDSIERTLRDLQRAVYRGEAPPPAGGASQPATGGVPPEALTQRLVSNEQRMSDIEAELRRLTSAIETAVHDVDVMKARVDKLVADVDFRLTALERSAGDRPAPVADSATQLPGQQGIARATENAGGVATPPPQQAAATATEEQALPDGTPVEQYEHALSLLMITARYDTAERAFKAFLASHGEHPLAANAQYWLGETYYVRKNYADAAAAFIEGYTRYPEGPKAADNLLKLGMSLAALKNVDDACASFAELKTRFPTADRRLIEQADQQRAKLECK